MSGSSIVSIDLGLFPTHPPASVSSSKPHGRELVQSPVKLFPVKLSKTATAGGTAQAAAAAAAETSGGASPAYSSTLGRALQTAKESETSRKRTLIAIGDEGRVQGFHTRPAGAGSPQQHMARQLPRGASDGAPLLSDLPTRRTDSLPPPPRSPAHHTTWDGCTYSPTALSAASLQRRGVGADAAHPTHPLLRTRAADTIGSVPNANHLDLDRTAPQAAAKSKFSGDWFDQNRLDGEGTSSFYQCRTKGCTEGSCHGCNEMCWTCSKELKLTFPGDDQELLRAPWKRTFGTIEAIKGGFNSESEHSMEAIKARRVSASGVGFEYYVKWDGYDSAHNTWEPAAEVEHSTAYAAYITGANAFGSYVPRM